MPTDTQTKNFGFVRVQVSRGTCYGSTALTIEMSLTASEKASCEFTEGFKNKKISLNRAEAEFFLGEIFKITEQPEVLTNLRHVEIRYHVEIEWKNLTFIRGEKSGKFKALTNEWLVDEIEEFIKYEAETPEIGERFQKILDTKPHRHALEIYRTVKRFSRKHLI